MRPTGVMPVPSIPWHIAHFAKNSCRPACKFPAEACNGFFSRRERIGIAKFRALRATALSRWEGTLVARNPRRTSNTKQSVPVITKIAKTSSVFPDAFMSRCHEILHLGLHRETFKSWELAPPAAGRSVSVQNQRRLRQRQDASAWRGRDIQRESWAGARTEAYPCHWRMDICPC